MARDWKSDSAIPNGVREGLNLLCNQLSSSLGDRMVSVILYGGLAKGEYAPSSSDVNVLLVLKEATVEILEIIAPTVRKGMRDFGLSVMVMTEDGLRHSTDVFPIKFLDMKRHYIILRGKDLLDDLIIAKDHLRLRCEQEIRNLLLRLRQFYIQRGSRSESVESILDAAISSFLTSLGGVLILKNCQAPTGKAAIIEAAVRELGLEGKPLQEVLALKRGKYEPDAAELKRLYGTFMATVQKAADIVDRLGE